MKETYYTVEQISEMLSIHPKTVQRYIREGKLRAAKIGKGWRVTGHDLSAFAENLPPAGTEIPAEDRVKISAVADIRVPHRDEAIRVMNALTAGINAKPPEFGQSSLHAQYIEQESTVRVTLWGGARFMAAVMDGIAMLTEDEREG